jgi:hypothetical protein
MWKFVSAAMLCCAPAVRGQPHVLTVSYNRTEAYVPFTTGEVSAEYVFNLVNSGGQPENIEHGVDSASSGTTWHLDSLANPVRQGDLTRTTVVVYGTGGLFPYWIDYWAQISGYPDTRKVVRLTIDTLASSGIRSAGADHSTTNRRVRWAVTMLAHGSTAEKAVSLAGRTTPRQSEGAQPAGAVSVVASPR